MPFVKAGPIQIFDELEARLVNLTVANGYPFDIGTIYRGRLEPPKWDDLPYLNFWAVGLQREGTGRTAGTGRRADYLQNSRQLVVTVAITEALAPGDNFMDVAATLSDAVETAMNRDVSLPNVDDRPLTYIDPLADIRLDRIRYVPGTDTSLDNEAFVTAELDFLIIYRTENGKPYDIEAMF